MTSGPLLLPPPSPARPSALRSAAGMLLAVGLLGATCTATAQAQVQVAAGSCRGQPRRRRRRRPRLPVQRQRPQATTRPLWSRTHAGPAAGPGAAGRRVDTLSEAQKRKWLALSAELPASMPRAEQAKLHSRMTEWAALSPQQRTQARLNFAETKQLSPDDKKAKWEAYQALSAGRKAQARRRRRQAARQRRPP